ncbi:SIMPL domain-containing protein [Cereibacter changlensis]|uniref:SIMPL domain-containing protein n=1 Tax=Cereibacter changlensis TaxID=402884 RepID=UPI0040342A37
MRILNALMLATALAMPAAAAMAEAESPRITVTGTGSVDSRPDMATISLGVTTQGGTAAEAMGRNSEELARVLEKLRASGVEDRDLQTSGLSLNPNWTNSNDGTAATISGYVASNQLTIRVRALDSLGGILDAAVKDGANTLNGVAFGLTDPKPVEDEARKRAVQDAAARAALLTTAAGVQLGQVLSITEGGGFEPPRPMYRMDAAEASAVPMAEGEVSTAASVTVVYAINQ